MSDLLRLTVQSLDLEANAIARHEGKVVFVRGALPGERVQARLVRSKARYDVAETIVVERESSQRVPPRCPHYGVCGGCSMQHLATGAQLAVKQRVLEDQLQHLAGLRATRILRPIAGPSWHYRFRARLSVRHVYKKGVVLVGFRERAGRYVTDMDSCEVLPAEVSTMLPDLRLLIASMDGHDRMPQIELAVGERPGGGLKLAFVFRTLDPVTPGDVDRFRAFARASGAQIWFQPKGPDTIVALDPANSDLEYRLPEFGVTMPFRPTDFTQVNHAINRVLVRQAVDLLDPRPGEQVADLFCGLGNFSLPIARRGAQVTGIEGHRELCVRAEAAAARNGLSAQTRFLVGDLFREDALSPVGGTRFDRMLIDPPREGAAAVCTSLAAAPQLRPGRIVYVSCNPATLARDAAILVHQAGYVLREAGVVNMFPHTSHVESMARFELGRDGPQ